MAAAMTILRRGSEGPIFDGGPRPKQVIEISMFPLFFTLWLCCAWTFLFVDIPASLLITS